MGGFFSKKSARVTPVEANGQIRNTGSAPARLEGLDGTSPPDPDTPRPDDSPAIHQHKARAASADSAFINAGSLDTKPPVWKVDVVGEQTDGSGLAAALKPASTVVIPDDALPWAAIFGEPAIRDLVSPEWKAREAGLHAIIRSLQNAKFHAMHDSRKTYDIACAILCRALKDKVAPLYFAALEVFDAVLNAFASRVEPMQLSDGIDTYLIMLLNRCGNSNARISELSTQAVLSIAQQPMLGTPFLGPRLLAPLPPPKGGNPAAGLALLAGRLDLISALLVATRSSKGMTTEGLLAFCRPALETPEERVRHAAIRTVGEVYKLRLMAGEKLQLDAQLPGLKPALLQVLQRKCEELCGDFESDGPCVTGRRDDQPVGGSGGIQIMGKGMSVLPPLPPRNSGSSFLPALPGASRREGPSDDGGGGVFGTRSALPPPSMRMKMAFNGGLEGAEATDAMPSSPNRSPSRLRAGASPARTRMTPANLTPSASPPRSPARPLYSKPATPEEPAARAPSLLRPSPSRSGATSSGGGGPRSASRPRMPNEPNSGGAGPKVLDDAEESLLESIMNAEPRR